MGVAESTPKTGQSLLPTTFLRQLIRFYGNSVQTLVPSYLEFTIDRLTSEQHKLRDQMETAFGTKFIPGQAVRATVFDQLEEHTRTNMLMFSKALSMLNPFAPTPKSTSAPVIDPDENEPPDAEEDDLETVRRDMLDLQKRLDRLSSKPE